MRRTMLAALFLALAGAAAAQETEIRIRPRQSAEDESHAYFAGLLKLALDKTAAEYGSARVVLAASSLTQSRSLAEVEDGRLLDIDWVGTNKEREEKLLPIRVPLTGGMLGYRVPVIRREDVPKWDAVASVEEIKKLAAIQGSQWPDSDILEAADFKVERVVAFESMYKMLKGKRGDYFPRGLNEVYAEVAALKDPELVAYDKVLIAYRFPMYFFTSKAKAKLAERIEKGLRAAIKDGSFLDYMKKSPVTAAAFPLSKYAASRIFELPNPYLPAATPLGDASLWLKVGK